VVATVIGTAIVICRYKLFFENYVVYKSVREQKHAHVLLRSISFAVAKIWSTVASAHVAVGLRPWPLARRCVPPALPCLSVSPGLF